MAAVTSAKSLFPPVLWLPALLLAGLLWWLLDPVAVPPHAEAEGEPVGGEPEDRAAQQPAPIGTEPAPRPKDSPRLTAPGPAPRPVLVAWEDLPGEERVARLEHSSFLQRTLPLLEEVQRLHGVAGGKVHFSEDRLAPLVLFATAPVEVDASCWQELRERHRQLRELLLDPLEIREEDQEPWGLLLQESRDEARYEQRLLLLSPEDLASREGMGLALALGLEASTPAGRRSLPWWLCLGSAAFLHGVADDPAPSLLPVEEVMACESRSDADSFKTRHQDLVQGALWERRFVHSAARLAGRLLGPEADPHTRRASLQWCREYLQAPPDDPSVLAEEPAPGAPRLALLLGREDLAGLLQ